MWLSLECWLSENFPLPLCFIFFLLGSPSLITSLVSCSFYFPSDCSPFAHLNGSLLVSAWNFGSSSSKVKALLGNLYWYILILTQSFAGLMGWRDMSFCFSHFHLGVMRVLFRLFIWGILFLLLESFWISKECYFIQCPTFRGVSVNKNVAKEVWTRLHHFLYLSMHAISLILTFRKWRKHLQSYVSSRPLKALELRNVLVETAKY